ncbi:thioesterase II family protein [Cohnella faecalis]|nr:alpha/beta fold hydrolase [Cohnella faecalis]
MDRVTLFMFPYAGASASVYEKWKPLFHESIDIVPVEIPGRGKRFPEPPLRRIGPIVEDAYTRIEGQLSERPYALFGHSLGSVVAFELARKAKRLGKKPPVRLFVSGRAAPQVKELDEPVYLLPDERFKQKIRSLGGTPPEFFQNEQLLSLFLPILKADYEASDTYRDEADASDKLSCGMTVLHGTEDEPCDPSEWSVHSTGTSDFHEFEGGHFFINEHAKPVAELINRLLCTKEERTL